METYLNPLISDVTERIVALLSTLEDVECDAETLEDTLQALTDVADEEIEAILVHMDNLTKDGEFLKAKAKDLNERAKAMEAKKERLKQFIDDHLKATRQTGVKNVGIYRLWFRKGSEVVQVDESILPEKYFVPQPAKPLGKPELAKLLKAGEQIEGAALVRNPDTLQIK